MGLVDAAVVFLTDAVVDFAAEVLPADVLVGVLAWVAAFAAPADLTAVLEEGLLAAAFFGGGADAVFDALGLFKAPRSLLSRPPPDFEALVLLFVLAGCCFDFADFVDFLAVMVRDVSL